jgi:non-heme chloroperoxidase
MHGTHDRRRHGRSSQRRTGNDVDTHANDLAALVEKLDIKNTIFAGLSTRGGGIAR